jgi:tellurite resistance protein TerC
VLPVSKRYDGGKVHTRSPAGRFMFTPMFIVMIAIGTTDLIFALDSIPAIFGLTKEPFLVFTANVFALMGLRQLYFLLGGLLQRLVYLSLGLAAILGFIGVKLILEAMAGNNLPFINNGKPIPDVPHISIGWSLGVIVAILAVAAVASVVKSARDARREGLAAAAARRSGAGSSRGGASSSGAASPPEGGPPPTGTQAGRQSTR